MSLLDDFETIVAKQRNSKEYIMEYWLYTCTKIERTDHFTKPQKHNVIYYHWQDNSGLNYSVFAIVDGEIKEITLSPIELYSFCIKFDKLKQ